MIETPANPVEDHPGVGFIVGRPGSYRFYLYANGLSRGGYSNVGACRTNMEMHSLSQARTAAGIQTESLGTPDPDPAALELAKVYLCGVAPDGAQVQQWANDHLINGTDDE